jgi:hypothetical protein
MTKNSAAIATVSMLLVSLTVHGQHPAMPQGMTHEQHLAQIQKEEEINKRGATAMGFDQDAVTHHFLLKPTGGAIEVHVRDPLDTKNLDAIRTHLRDIATQFAAGNFEAPFATHGEVPPGVSAMTRLKSTITYSYDQTASGGRVEIVTQNAAALAAIHDFLRYQIVEHHTGDPLTIE